jgi:hypothetical protein
VELVFHMIYLLTAIGLSPGGSTHLHTNNAQNNTNDNRTTQITNVEECGPCPVFASFTLAFALQPRKKRGKTSVTVRKTSVKVQYTYYQKHPHITKPSQTHTTKPTHTHTRAYTLQNNIKPPQYKLKRNAYRKSKSTYFLMLLIHRYNTSILMGPSLHFTNHKYPFSHVDVGVLIV